MSELRITPEGLPELVARLHGAPRSVSVHLDRALDRGAIAVQATGKERVRKRTRTLARSIHIERRGQYARAIGTNLVYARIHEEGGTIKAKRGRFLRFRGRDGRYVYVKSVHITAQPYMRPALDENRAYIQRQADEAAGRIAGDLAGR